MRCGIVTLPTPFIPTFDFGLENSQKEFPAGGVLKICGFQKIRKHTRRVLQGERFKQGREPLYGDMAGIHTF